jgi:hypothetical protein
VDLTVFGGGSGALPNGLLITVYSTMSKLNAAHLLLALFGVTSMKNVN